MSIRFIRPDVVKALPRYALIRDVLGGSDVVKGKRELYLPKPDPKNISSDNIERYEFYLKLAVFYNITARTHISLKGQIDVKPHTLKLSNKLSFLEKNADGNGVGILQLAKKACSEVLAVGRFGLLTDFPKLERPYTNKDVQSGIAVPRIVTYSAESIRNWKIENRNGRILTTMIVLEEIYKHDIDIFETEERTQYRVLGLDQSGFYYQFSIKEDDLTEGDVLTEEYMLQRAVYPTKNDGSKFTEIPFVFSGSVNNDPDIDDQPMYTISVINIAHYINSAEYEDSTYLVGQPTLIIAGLTNSWIEKNGTIKIGSRKAIPIATDGQAFMLQPDPNIMAFDAMKHKEKIMASLGASLVKETSVEKTATQSGIEHSAETSILKDCVNNVTDALMTCMKWCKEFVGDTDESILKLNTDFDILKLSTDARMQLMAEWQAGAIDDDSYADILKNEGVLRTEYKPSHDNSIATKIAAKSADNKMK